MTTTWQRIKAELAKRPDATGREIAYLAEQLRCKLQVVNNWPERGVPPARLPAIAKILGWSVDELLGRPATTQSAWPFELIQREVWDKLTERQRGAIEAAALRELQRLTVQSKYIIEDKPLGDIHDKINKPDQMRSDSDTSASTNVQEGRAKWSRWEQSGGKRKARSDD